MISRMPLLDDGLGTLIAWEQGHIQPRAAQHAAACVQNGVQLRMDDIGILCLRTLALPRKDVVAAAAGQTVITGGENDVVRRDDAGADLRVRVLAAAAASRATPMKYSSQEM